MRILLLILVLIFSCALAATPPALKISLSGQAADKVAAHFLPMIFSKLSNVHIPDINQTIHSPLGDINVEITNMTVSLQEPVLDVDMIDNQVCLNIQLASLLVAGHPMDSF